MSESNQLGNQPEFAQFGGERRESAEQWREDTGRGARLESDRVIEINRPARARSHEPAVEREQLDEWISGRPMQYVDTFDETPKPHLGESLNQEVPGPAFERDFSRARHNVPGDFSGRGPKSYRRRDERIYEDVCEALTRDPRIDASEVEVVVYDGEVTLAGSVESGWMLRAAEQASSSADGVRRVKNEIRVQEHPREAS
jgi:hypothetical protein